MSNLNPGIKKLKIGTRELREVTVYPLSMKDQLEIPELISQAFTQYSEAEAKKAEAREAGESKGFKNDVETVTGMIDTIKDNIEDIIKQITDEDDNVSLDDMTNDQFIDFVTIIFEVNYESAMGKFKALAGKIKAMLPQPPTPPTEPESVIV